MAERSAEEDLFARAMEGVERLESDRQPRVVRRRRPATASPPADLGAPARFTIERLGDHVEGTGPGVGREALRRLQRGKVPVEVVVDLHGHSEPSGHDLVVDTLTAALSTGRRCLLFVHGRGVHSEGLPVLKERLPGWLAERPHGPRVLAFTSAGPELGGTGATLVLLRKPKKPRG